MRTALLAAMALAACQSTHPAAGKPASPAADAAIDDASRAYIQLIQEISPESATALGLHARDSFLDDRSPAGFEAATGKEEAMLASLESRLTGADASLRQQIDLTLLEHTLRVDIRQRRELRPLEREPDVYCSPMNAIFLMSARDYAPAAERAGKLLDRMERVPSVIEAAKANLRRPPRVWTEIGIECAEGAKTFFDEQRPFLRGALPDQTQRIEAAISRARDAYLGYAAFLRSQVLPRSDGNYAAGSALFEFLLRENYFLPENAQAVLARGKRVFEETVHQLDEVARQIDPAAKSWFEVTAEVKGKHPSAADVLPSYDREVKRARQFLVDRDVVDFPPGDDCRTVETPAFERGIITAAYDQPPAFDPGTQGFFFVTPVDLSLPPAEQERMLREDDYADEVNTAVHEVYPGHHLQISFARRHPSVIRKATTASIFVEGWGLYSEELMNELGYYTPAERLLQLEWTLVRAARVIIDVGLHTGGMSFEQAVSMLTDQVHLEKPLAVSEVQRYTESPTQPLSYLIGREKILDLRARYRAVAGGAYSLKAFHRELLAHGSIAPGLIEREMFPGAPRAN